MSLILANITGWVIAHWKTVAILAAIGVIALVSFLFVRSCLVREPKLNQEQIIKAQQAIEKEDRKAMIEVLAESKVKEQDIDNSVKAAEEATEKAKRDYSQLSNDELAAEIERRLNP